MNINEYHDKEGELCAVAVETKFVCLFVFFRLSFKHWSYVDLIALFLLRLFFFIIFVFLLFLFPFQVTSLPPSPPCHCRASELWLQIFDWPIHCSFPIGRDSQSLNRLPWWWRVFIHSFNCYPFFLSVLRHMSTTSWFTIWKCCR